MLRGTERKAALESLSRARTRYESQATDTQTAITDLFLLRQKCSKDLIARCEHFVNRDAHGLVDWSATALDGSNIRALKCAAGAQKNIPISAEIMGWVALAVVLAPKSIWRQTEVVCR